MAFSSHTASCVCVLRCNVYNVPHDFYPFFSSLAHLMTARDLRSLGAIATQCDIIIMISEGSPLRERQAAGGVLLLRCSCTTKHCVKTVLPVCQLAQNLYPVSCVSARVRHKLAQQKGNA